MNREEIMQKLKTYEEHEIFYREYYLAKQNLNSKKSFLSQFDPNELYQKRLIVPDIKGSWRPTFMNEEIMDQRDLIKELTVLKHFRYTPTFKHECKCQYKNDQKVENKNVHFPRSIPQFVFP